MSVDKNYDFVFISNIASPYNVEYLNEISKTKKVIAIFEKRESSERDKSWSTFNNVFKMVFLKGISVGKDVSLSFGICKYLRLYNGKTIVIGNPLTPTGIIAIIYCRMKRIPFNIQSEGGFVGSKKGLKESFKKWILKGADLYLSGMKGPSDYFLQYGCNPDKVKNYPFASFHKSDILTKMPSQEEKNKVKVKLGMNGIVVLFVGRFIKGKGIDCLIKACKGIDDITLCLVGGELTNDYARIVEENNIVGKIKVFNHINTESLKEIYLASDIFVLPTHSDTWGLVINEAMAYGLPIITTKKCVAGLQLIDDCQNGFLIDVGDFVDLHNKILLLKNSFSLRTNMGSKNLSLIQPYCYENMAKVILGYLN